MSKTYYTYADPEIMKKNFNAAFNDTIEVDFTEYGLKCKQSRQ